MIFDFEIKNNDLQQSLRETYDTSIKNKYKELFKEIDSIKKKQGSLEYKMSDLVKNFEKQKENHIDFKTATNFELSNFKIKFQHSNRA